MPVHIGPPDQWPARFGHHQVNRIGPAFDGVPLRLECSPSRSSVSIHRALVASDVVAFFLSRSTREDNALLAAPGINDGVLAGLGEMQLESHPLRHYSVTYEAPPMCGALFFSLAVKFSIKIGRVFTPPGHGHARQAKSVNLQLGVAPWSGAFDGASCWNLCGSVLFRIFARDPRISAGWRLLLRIAQGVMTYG